MLRHAHSHELRGVRDHERPLSELGRAEAQQVAQLLAESGWLPDHIICSNALRTQQTVRAMRDAVSAFRELEVQYFPSLYAVAAMDGQTRQHLSECVLQVAADGVQCVLCIGHNKGWEEAASCFAGTPVRLETANAALLQVDKTSWEEAFADGVKWELVGVLIPQGLQSA